MIDDYCAHLARLNRRPGTIYQQRRTLMRLAAMLGGPILLATLDDLRTFTSRGLGDEALYAEVSRLRCFYRWAVREGHLEHDPTVRLERPTRRPGLPRPMPRADVERVLGEAPEPLRAWFLLAARAGLRACEIAPVRSSDVADGVLVLPEQKGGGAGVVPLSPGLRAALGSYLAGSGWWFPHGTDPDRHVTAGQVSKRANAWLRDSGIAHTLHSLRHTYATNVYRLSGHDLLLTAQLLRHRKLDTTRRYAELSPDRATSVVAMLDGAA